MYKAHSLHKYSSHINIRIMQPYVENNCIKYFLLKDIIYAYIINHINISKIRLRVN